MTDPLTSVLRDLDPAPRSLTAAQTERAGATLDRILLTDPGTAGREQSPASAPATTSTSRWRRPIQLAAAAAAVAVGWAGYSSVTNAEPAFASWTAVPAAATPHDVTVARDACRRGWRAGPSLDWGKARVVLAERRGAFVAVILRTRETDASLHCLVRNESGSADAEVIDAGGGAGAGTPRERPASIPPDAIGEFTFTDRFDRGGAAMADGIVGTRVVAVTVHVGAVAVRATVHDGLFAAWWPTKGPLSRSLANGPRAITRVDLTLADGRVIRDALADGRVIRDAVPRHLP